MSTTERFIAMSLCMLLCAPMTLARSAQGQQQDAKATNPTSQDVMIIIQQDKVRFTIQKAVEEARLQVSDQTGELVYDSGVITEPELNWPLQNANGEPVKSGLYGYTLTIKAAGDETARVRRGHFIVDRALDRDGQTDHLWVTSQNDNGVGADLTVARTEGATVAGTRITGDRTAALNRDSATGVEAAKTEKTEKLESNATPDKPITGTAGQIAKFTSATDLGNSIMTELSGNIGVGVASPQQRLHVDGNEILSTGWAAGFKFRNRNSTSSADDWVWYSQDNLARLWSARAGDLLVVTTNGAVGVGTKTPDPAARLNAYASSGHAIRGDSHDGQNNASGVFGYNDGGGWGTFGYSTTGFAGLFGSGGNNGVFGLTANAGASGVYGKNDSGGLGVFGQAMGANGTGVLGRYDGPASQSGWGVFGFSPNGFAGVFGSGGKNGVYGQTASANDSGVYGNNSGGGYGVFGYSVNGTGVFGASQNGLAADFAGRTRTRVLEITGGSDFSENFDINARPSNAVEAMKVEPGLVVSIDPDNPGKLALSSQAYDRRVAGIISGAGGVKPGMMMSQPGTLADGQFPVALSGRVYCWVDATQGAIEPGDLLTTSNTPGHAMKATDAAKAQGAIIGKAMTGLKEGKGLALVLVTLQ